jgi:hypothetical protein
MAGLECKFSVTLFDGYSGKVGSVFSSIHVVVTVNLEKQEQVEWEF